MAAVLEHTDELHGLAENPTLPAPLLDLFIATADQALCADLADRDDLTPERVGALARRGGDLVVHRLIARGKIPVQDIPRDDPLAMLAALDLAEARAGWMPELATHADAAIRSAVADRAGWDRPDILRLLAGDGDVEVLREVALAAALPPDLGWELLRIPDVVVRDALARNDATPPEVLAELLDDGGDPPVETCEACRRNSRAGCTDHAPGVLRIQVSALGNPATPTAAMAGFVDCPDRWGRIALAGRPDLPAGIYEHLAGDADAGVRTAIAENSAVAVTLMERLAGDPAAEVRRALLDNPAVPLRLLTRLASSTRVRTNELPPRVATASTDALTDLATASVAQVRALAAARSDLPADMITTLLDDPDHGVAKRLARNQRLDADQLRALAKRHGPRVYASLAKNPHCPPDLLRIIAEAGKHAEKALRDVADHPGADQQTLLLCFRSDQARRRAADRPELPATVIATLMEDPDFQVRMTAASNPSLPVELMRRLLKA